jgi:hypothetical protein
MALIGERAMMAPVFRLSWKEIQGVGHRDEPQNEPRKPQRYSGKATTFIWLTGFFERDLNFYLQTMEQSISLASLAPPQILTLTNRQDTAIKVAHKRGFVMTGMILASLSSAAVREANTLASIELASTALAVERFRHRRGRLPASLTEIAPEFLEKLPADPFDGAPLRYRVLSQGYILYSVGRDGHDDGGRESPQRKKSYDTNSFDNTFIVEH